MINFIGESIDTDELIQAALTYPGEDQYGTVLLRDVATALEASVARVAALEATIAAIRDAANTDDDVATAADWAVGPDARMVSIHTRALNRIDSILARAGDAALLRENNAKVLRDAAKRFRSKGFGAHLYPGDLEVLAAAVEKGEDRG